jgi:hypothetical protein
VFLIRKVASFPTINSASLLLKDCLLPPPHKNHGSDCVITSIKTIGEIVKSVSWLKQSNEVSRLKQPIDEQIVRFLWRGWMTS